MRTCSAFLTITLKAFSSWLTTLSLETELLTLPMMRLITNKFMRRNLRDWDKTHSNNTRCDCCPPSRFAGGCTTRNRAVAPSQKLSERSQYLLPTLRFHYTEKTRCPSDCGCANGWWSSSTVLFFLLSNLIRLSIDPSSFPLVREPPPFINILTENTLLQLFSLQLRQSSRNLWEGGRDFFYVSIYNLKEGKSQVLCIYLYCIISSRKK